MERKNPTKKKTVPKAARRKAEEERHPKFPNFVKRGRTWVFSPRTSADMPEDPKDAGRLDRIKHKGRVG